MPASLDLLRDLFAASPAAARAVAPLSRSARVALLLDDGPARFDMATGTPRLTPGAEPDPDFTLQLPEAAVRKLALLASADVGALGVAFFELLVSADPAERARATVQASLARLVTHGYLGVLALGGARVALWLLRRGLADPRAVIDRLRRRP